MKTNRTRPMLMLAGVVLAAKAALEKNDVTPVLKWVKPEADRHQPAPAHPH